MSSGCSCASWSSVRASSAGADTALSLDQLAQLQPDDIFQRLWRQRFGEDAPADQLAAFAELLIAGDRESA